MAVTMVKVFTSDLSGTRLEEDEVRRVRFGFEGQSYVLDLTSDEAGELTRILEPYVKAAAPDSANTPARQSRKPRPKADAKAARAWLQANGYEVADRGRIPGELLDAYQSKTRAG